MNQHCGVFATMWLAAVLSLYSSQTRRRSHRFDAVPHVDNDKTNDQPLKQRTVQTAKSTVLHARFTRSSCHIFLLSQLSTLTTHNSLSLSLPAQDLPFSQIFPTRDSHQASGLTSWLYDWSISSEHLGFWATVCKTVRPLSVHCLSVCL